MTAGATPSLHSAVERSYADLLRLIYARTGSRQLAEDAVQETWIRAAKAPVDTPRNPTAYVRRMAINIAIDLMRASRVNQQVPIVANPGGAAGPEPVDHPAPDVEIEDVIASRQQMRMLTRVLRKMPAKRRNAFLLCRVGGLTMRETGARLGISERTVEKHVARALLECRHFLGRH